MIGNLLMENSDSMHLELGSCYNKYNCYPACKGSRKK